MSSFKAFDIAGSGMAAQSVRLNTTASNLANAESVSGDPANVYKPRHPIFEAVRASLSTNPTETKSAAAVKVSGIYESPAPAVARYEPGNPLANADGYVYALGLDGKLRWRGETEGATLSSEKEGFDRKTIQGSPAIADGKVYVGSRDAYLYAFDLRDGKRLWRVGKPAPSSMASRALWWTTVRNCVPF